MPNPQDNPSDETSEATFGSWVRPRPEPPERDGSARAGADLAGATPTGGDLSSASRPVGAPEAGEAEPGDQTIVSKNPPLAPDAAYLGLRPRDLGRALVGQRIGGMRLEEFIGGGGMGAVFRALDESLDRTVAVKVLAAHPEADEDSHRRFEVEGRSAARLDHPNIARVHYVGEDRGLRYIVFEYIAGANVRDVVAGSGVFSVADAVSFTLQITDALAHAWRRGVVHRDIKPSNLLITRSGQAKLVDMGLARMHQVESSELTTSGTTLGTFDYLAPEQARDPRNADARSDIYSLGCTLYYMLTGRPPFPEGTAIQKLLRHQGDEPESLSRFRSDAPRALGAILSKMLAKKPEGRYQTPQELEAALLMVARQIGVSPVLPVPAGGVAYQPAPPREWSPALVWLAPAAVLVAIGVLLPNLGAVDAPGTAFTQIESAGVEVVAAEPETRAVESADRGPDPLSSTFDDRADAAEARADDATAGEPTDGNPTDDNSTDGSPTDDETTGGEILDGEILDDETTLKGPAEEGAEAAALPVGFEGPSAILSPAG